MIPPLASPPRRDPLGTSLGWAMSRVLPGREETWLLKSVLHRGPSAQQAWEAFSSSIRDLPSLFRTDTGGRKRLSPLLLASLRENALPADPGLLTVLRTAYVREQLRAEAFRRIACGVFEALRDSGVPFLVLKGTALAETVYAEPSLRHSHDIDLLIAEDDLERARQALSSAGLSSGPALPWAQGLRMRHASATPVLLLTRLYRLPFYRSHLPGLWARSCEVDLAAVGSPRVLSPADNLLHALGHASYCPSRSTLQWVTDAWMIIELAPRLEWEDLFLAVGESLLEIPAFVMLRYLKEELGARVPEETVARLGEMAGAAGPLRRDVALYGARQRRGRHPRLSGLRRPGWKDQLDLARWQVFPSQEYIRWAYGNPPSILVPFIYLMRPFTYLAETFRWRLLGMLRSWKDR